MALEKLLPSICCLVVLGASTTEAAKSAFIISRHQEPSHAQAFTIDANQVAFQDMVDIGTYNQGFGAVGAAVWPEKQLLFVTYENSPMIVWASTKTLQKVGEFNTGAFNLAGVSVDRNNETIYVVKRENNDLYLYSFDEVHNNMVLDAHYSLSVPSGSLTAWGIALDEINDFLYISTNTNTVEVYNTDDWSHDHNLPILVDGTPRSAVGLALDQVRGYVYTGHWQQHNYLVRTTTSSPYASTEVEIRKLGSESRCLLGVDVDDETGLVYCTTYHNDLRVYDYNLVLHDTEENDDIYGPAGVALGGLYKPPRFKLEKTDDVNGCLLPGQDVNYTITYDVNGYADSNVAVTDFLRPDVNFISASDGGQYDPNTHTVTWDINDFEPNEAGSLTLSVKVNNFAEPGGKIVNYCEIESDNYCTPVRIDANVCCYPTDIIYVDAHVCVFNFGTSWQYPYCDLQDALHRASTCEANEIWVAAGPYKPGTKTGDTFELVDGVPLYGGFDASETTRDQRDWLKNQTILTGDDQVYDVVTAEYLGQAAIDGFTITAALWEGICCYDANLTVRNSTIKENAWHGIYCWTDSATSSLTLTQSKLVSNTGCGVNLNGYSTSVITNNWISDNWSHGIELSSDGPHLIHNNTIVGNGSCGVNAVSLPPYAYATVDVNNSIIWDNTGGAFDPSGGGSTYNVTYSCVQDCNYVQDPNLHNICTDPCFVNDPNDPNNYHLGPGSPCKDAIDDPNFYPDDTNETDIDDEPRIMGDCNEFLDMGADEVYFPNCWNCPTQCHGDSDCDANVAGSDFIALKDSWYACYGEPNYNPCADFDRNGCVKGSDFLILKAYWYQTLEPNCPCGGTWPPNQGRGESTGQGGGGAKYYLDAEDQLLLEEIVAWLTAYKPPEWEEFLLLLVK